MHIVRSRDLIGPRTRTSKRSSFCRARISRKSPGRNLNKSFTVEEPATIGRAEHGNDLALYADVTNFLGCPHNLPFKSSPVGVQKTLTDAPCGCDRCQINGTSRPRLSERALRETMIVNLTILCSGHARSRKLGLGIYGETNQRIAEYRPRKSNRGRHSSLRDPLLLFDDISRMSSANLAARRLIAKS